MNCKLKKVTFHYWRYHILVLLYCCVCAYSLNAPQRFPMSYGLSGRTGKCSLEKAETQRRDQNYASGGHSFLRPSERVALGAALDKRGNRSPVKPSKGRIKKNLLPLRGKFPWNQRDRLLQVWKTGIEVRLISSPKDGGTVLQRLPGSPRCLTFRFRESPSACPQFSTARFLTLTWLHPHPVSSTGQALHPLPSRARETRYDSCNTIVICP